MLFACVAETFPTGTYGVSRALSRKIGMGPAGEAQEKRESQRYHEWQRRSQQRAQCAPAAAAKGRGASVGMHRGCSGPWENVKTQKK